MSNQPRRSFKLLWSVMAAALVALWPPPAWAGLSGHRIRPAGAHQQRLKRHGQPENAKRAAPVRAAPATSR